MPSTRFPQEDLHKISTGEFPQDVHRGTSTGLPRDIHSMSIASTRSTAHAPSVFGSIGLVLLSSRDGVLTISNSIFTSTPTHLRTLSKTPSGRHAARGRQGGARHFVKGELQETDTYMEHLVFCPWAWVMVIWDIWPSSSLPLLFLLALSSASVPSPCQRVALR